jgi:hypothetical protein
MKNGKSQPCYESGGKSYVEAMKAFAIRQSELNLDRVVDHGLGLRRTSNLPATRGDLATLRDELIKAIRDSQTEVVKAVLTRSKR